MPVSPTGTGSISPGPSAKSKAAWLASLPKAIRTEFEQALEDGHWLALPHLFDIWAMAHQVPPAGDWRTWVILGGRGAGKTRAGAEWVRAQVEGPRPLDPGRARRVALVGETLDQVREVMVLGDSGLIACSPPERRPVWKSTRNCLVWPNGAEAMAFSAHAPESLRGPQFDGAWADELAKWRNAQDTWDMLQFGLRLGDLPQVCVTTTPRDVPVLRDLLAMDSTVMTQASTQANAANLARSFLTEVEARYGGTRLGRQELDGVMVADLDGALWTRAMLADLQIPRQPALGRIVVALDPPVSSHAGSDACGIVVAGLVDEPGGPRRAIVLEDASIQGASPSGWAKRALDAVAAWRADRLVVEVNQGGDLVEQVLRSLDADVALTKVHASRGKVARAEPVAALYEQNRVVHLRGMGRLEDEMCQMTVDGFAGKGSPDRVDALVWALTDLMLSGVARARPGVRTLG